MFQVLSTFLRLQKKSNYQELFIELTVLILLAVRVFVRPNYLRAQVIRKTKGSSILRRHPAWTMCRRLCAAGVKTNKYLKRLVYKALSKIIYQFKEVEFINNDIYKLSHHFKLVNLEGTLREHTYLLTFIVIHISPGIYKIVIES